MSDKFNPQDHYYDKQGNLSKRPKKDPSVLFFGLPLVDRWFNPKYIRTYVNRYDLGGNTNKIATEENFKFDHADLNDLKDDVLKNREEECTVGGEMQIAALAAAHVLDKQNSVATVGAVGDDSAKTVCLSAMMEAGVNPRYKVILNDGTGFRVVYDERDMSGNLTCCRYTVMRAGSSYKVADLKDSDTEAAIAKAAWLYIDAGSFYANWETTLALAERFYSDGLRVALNISHTDFIEDGHMFLSRLITLADVIIMNQDTAECFNQHSMGMGHRNWEEGAKHIANQPVFGADDSLQSLLSKGLDCITWVVVTRGDKDVAIIEGHPNFKSKTTMSYVKLQPAEKPSFEGWMPSDRRGVGDLFAGGLVAALAKGQKMEDAVLTGHKLAAYSITQEGPKLPPKGEA